MRVQGNTQDITHTAGNVATQNLTAKLSVFYVTATSNFLASDHDRDWRANPSHQRWRPLSMQVRQIVLPALDRGPTSTTPQKQKTCMLNIF